MNATSCSSATTCDLIYIPNNETIMLANRCCDYHPYHIICGEQHNVRC